jgi:hypothetical protein
MSLLSEQKSECLIVEFYYVDGPLAGPTLNESNRFTNLETTIEGFDPGEPDALSDPLIELKMPDYTGTLLEKPAVLRISNKSAIVQLMQREYSLPKIRCRVRKNIFDTELGLTSAPTEIMYLVDGECLKATYSPSNKPGTVEIVIGNAKDKTEEPSGMLATPQCAWTFGEAKTCTVDTVALQEQGTLTAITARGFQVTITGITAPTPHYWKSGFFYYNGVSLGIRDWDGADEFLLSQRVSYEMASAILPLTQIDASPGCRLILSDCRYYNNEDQFQALGINMPAHNPLFEKGND